jgi:hypothetical protein
MLTTNKNNKIMAIITKGIMGPVSGRVGSLVFCICPSGTNYVRSLPRKSSKAPSTAQVVQRSKFGFATRFLNKYSDLAKIGFPEGKRMTPRNRAMKELLGKGIAGAYPDWQIDYPKVVLSKGSTPTLSALEMVYAKPNEVLLRWESPGFGYMGIQDDLVRVVLYNATEGVFVVQEQAFRCDKQCHVQIPDWIRGDEAHVYVMVHSLRGTPSDSQYVGALMVGV